MYLKKIFFFTVLLFPLISFSQNATNENIPYSRFGIGDIRSGASTPLKAMGYCTSAFNSISQVNSENPASYSFLKFTTYEIGLEGGLRTVSTANNVYKTGTFTLSSLNVAFPISKKMGLNIGLKPVSRVYYNLADTVSTPNIGQTVYEYSGSGGINYAFLGLAYKVVKGLSFGVNLGYKFGTYNHNSALYNIDTTSVVNSEFVHNYQVGGFYWSSGLQYQTEIKKGIDLNIGTTLSLAQKIKVNTDNYANEFHYTNSVLYQDTAYSTVGIANKMQLPLSFSLGARLDATTWAASIDFQNTQWKKFTFNDAVDSNMKNAFRLGLGFEITPNPISKKQYLSRVTYRLGFYLGRDNVYLRNTNMNVWGLTWGASLPFKKGADRIHLGMEYGTRGTKMNDLIQEQIVRFNLGISLNDKWFIKRKYD